MVQITSASPEELCISLQLYCTKVFALTRYRILTVSFVEDNYIVQNLGAFAFAAANGSALDAFLTCIFFSVRAINHPIRVESYLHQSVLFCTAQSVKIFAQSITTLSRLILITLTSTASLTFPSVFRAQLIHGELSRQHVCAEALHASLGRSSSH